MVRRDVADLDRLGCILFASALNAALSLTDTHQVLLCM
jgi:hypothetical protein